MSSNYRQQYLQSSGPGGGDGDIHRSSSSSSSLSRPDQRPRQQVADWQPNSGQPPTNNHLSHSHSNNNNNNNNGDSRPPMKLQIPSSDLNYRHLRPSSLQSSGQAGDSSQSSNRRLHNNNNNINNLADPNNFGRRQQQQQQQVVDGGCQSTSNGENDGRQQCTRGDLLATSGLRRQQQTSSDEMFPGSRQQSWQHQNYLPQMAATRQADHFQAGRQAELGRRRHPTGDLEDYNHRQHQPQQHQQAPMKSLDKQQQQQQQQQPRHSTMSHPNYEDDDNDDNDEPDEINYQADVEYARELRRTSQRQQQSVNNTQDLHYANQSSSSFHQHHHERPFDDNRLDSTQQLARGAAGPNAKSRPANAPALHVNFFNRSSHNGNSNSSSSSNNNNNNNNNSGNGIKLNGDNKNGLPASRQDVKTNGQEEYDDDEAESGRKKKYLTAKYGQQQMNLIKKRLKIEMWLYEQLQELAKETKSEAELDEIDIDLDQLLDMEDDHTRRHWLSKTLEPFRLAGGPAANERIGAFIEDILSQSKLL